MAEHNILGAWGEKLAKETLIAKGYAITAENWRMGHYEVDIVAMRGNRIIFVEVKTRSTDMVDPLQAIDRKRINHLIRSANAFVSYYNLPHEVQFDLILIIGHPQAATPPRIEHIEDAFFPPLRTVR